MTLINKEHGFPIFDCGIATDDLEDLKAKITLALNNGDLIVTTGGVSMGDKDLLRQVLVKVRANRIFLFISRYFSLNFYKNFLAYTEAQ